MIIIGCCIYYKKSELVLRFDKEEHIIPAGLGGIRKLEKGSVSDEANEKFSKIETVLLRNSFVGFNRMNNGPGKRGSLNIKKVKNPVIRVLKQERTNVEFLLGFIFAGQSYIVPQIILDFNDNNHTVSPYFMATVLDEELIGDFPNELNKKLMNFLENKNRKFKLVYMPFETNKHFINIGYYKDRWYAATSHKKINMDFLAEDLLLPMINEMIAKYKNEEELSEKEVLIDLPFQYKDKINTDADTFYFLYLKTAFNALAFFKGTDYVGNKIFDAIRNSIINLNNLTRFIEQSENIFNSKLKDMVDRMPEKAHYVILCVEDSKLIAYVSFYGEVPGKIKILDSYQGEDFFNGLVCDWRNRKEFTLEDL